MFNKQVIEDIRNKVDILTFLENRGIAFRQTGSAWVGLCPVHSERSPSFNVNTNFQTFRCFGCGINGDIFSLVSELEGLSFPGAVQFLADEVGITLEATDDPDYKRRQRLLTILRMTSEWYRYNYKKLDQNHPARKNLADRDLAVYSMKDDSVGYAPAGDLIRLIKEKGFTEQEILDVGLATKNEETNTIHERFRNRLIWTIYNPQGHPIGFSARKIFDEDKGAKYINSPQTEFYNKSKILLGINSARREISKNQVAYIVEGQTDVMALKDAGFEGTVASCGTAFGKEHANLLLHLSKMGSNQNKFELVFCFDGDLAGVKAAKTVFRDNPNIQLNSYAVKFVTEENEATDPCDFRLLYGNDKLSNFINTKKVPLVEFVLNEMKAEWDLSSPEGKSGYLSASLEVLATVTDRIQYSSYLRKVASWSGVSYLEVNAIANQHKKRQSLPQEETAQTRQDQGLPVTPETQVLAGFVQHPKVSQNVLNTYPVSSSVFEHHTQLATKILEMVNTGVFDYNDPQFLELAHFNLNIAEERSEEGVTNLLKTFLRSEYARKSSLLDAELLSPGVDPVVAFTNLMQEQEKLKEIYYQL